MLIVPGSEQDCSLHLDGDDSFTNLTYHTHDTDDRKRAFFRRVSLNYQNIMQLVLMVVFGMMMFDSHHRVQKHKVQLQRYDDERAHILEQMMWIDKAAKKAHKNYAQKELWADINGEELVKGTKGELEEEAQGLRDAIKSLQLRIQLNARDRIEKRFGESPVHVSFSLDKEGSRHLVIGLSDDTPHAASILLDQIDKKMWNSIELQRLESGTIQVSTNLPATSPILEFIETSRSCHEIGSVALRQLEAEAMELHVLVLRIHMEEHAPMTADDVCIGKVLSGLDDLKSMGGIPRIRDEGEQG